MNNLAVFASGSGSNAENIFNYFNNHTDVSVPLFCCNNPKAFVIERSKNLGVECFLFNRDDFKNGKELLAKLKSYQIDYIVLAGFLWLIPEYLINAYPDKIINIHPALLPKYGGKGMYGDKVHQAVIADKEKESGITIHLVNENYDEGESIFQTKCTIENNDTPEIVAQKVHQLEYEYFPKVIERFILKK